MLSFCRHARAKRIFQSSTSKTTPSVFRLSERHLCSAFPNITIKRNVMRMEFTWKRWNSTEREHAPGAQGLYNPAYEKDSCGVGFVCNIKGNEDHQIIKDGLQMLSRVEHRGAVGKDARCGDGAGIMLSIPHKFFLKLGFPLPAKGNYGVGLVFLSKSKAKQAMARERAEKVVREFGQEVIGWRPVPVNNSELGSSKLSEPYMEQIFIRKDSVLNQNEFERVLYAIRKKIGLHSDGGPLDDARTYICSLSSNVLVYKGQLTPPQLKGYFPDLSDPDFQSHFCMIHSRFSTNTFPSWERAQPLRYLAHNGEINTLKGNMNAMVSREATILQTLPKRERSIFPVVEESASDSMALDNVVELLVLSGRSLPESMMLVVPEAYVNDPNMPQKKKDYYEYNSCLMEPWDGPAHLTFTDGKVIGAMLDRNGLRPGRFYITKDDRVVLASEAGVLDIAADNIASKGRVSPGRMFLVDFAKGQVVPDETIKNEVVNAQPYGDWLQKHAIEINDQIDYKLEERQKREKAVKDAIIEARRRNEVPPELLVNLKAFGYTVESLDMLLGPMSTDGHEALGSMGNDLALACLSKKARPVYDYFQQLFAQVTNPPIDPFREGIVMSLRCPIGPEKNPLEPTAEHAQRVFLNQPVLTPFEFWNLTHLTQPGWAPYYLDITFARESGPKVLRQELRKLQAGAIRAVESKARLIVLTDRKVNAERVPIDSLLAVGAVHQILVKTNLRSQVALVIETGDAREVHHHCCLVGFGADAVFPWLAYEAVYEVARRKPKSKDISKATAIVNYRNAVNEAMLKVMSKMGISTVQSYKGAMVFEALGVAKPVIDMCFTGVSSRIGGASFETFGADALRFHQHAYPQLKSTDRFDTSLRNPGTYHWRGGPRAEMHLNNPTAIGKLQEASRLNSQEAYDAYAKITNELAKGCTLRGLMRLKDHPNEVKPIDKSEVEPAKEIVKRFATGAMSYGSISQEVHSTLAAAMNIMGAKSNTGEGGEHISRYGNITQSAITQVASGRFGCTIHYLANSKEIQIKISQGAKPGEGGELPGYKVVGEIAKTRHSTPGVGLISPPPHHDIYSIEDLAQLIYDLRHANPDARISVKLVSEVGVGVVAAGVTKAKADHILISGHDGGTGAAKWTAIKCAGLPWELGLAESHQTLVLNGLRERVTLQTDGQLKTGLDVIKAALLGAEEFCFATAPLISLGCIMMRKCHLNTCPVGIATQDPELRKKFTGQPEHVINYFFLLAEECRGYMAKLGISSFQKLIGRSDLLEMEPQHLWKLQGLDLSQILTPAWKLDPSAAVYKCVPQENDIATCLDQKILKVLDGRWKQDEKCVAEFPIQNLDRTVGANISYEVTKYLCEARGHTATLPEDTIHIKFTGTAGQSFGAFSAKGLTLELEGESNDYVGKGLSGGKIVIYPPLKSTFASEENVIVGNTALYGATSGRVFLRGMGAERFAVRNSGADAVVEGVGDHGCEYMTGGRVIILGDTGRNFAAGMSGGLAYVYDRNKKFGSNVNLDMVGLTKLNDPEYYDEQKIVRTLLEEHFTSTGSPVAKKILESWNFELPYFIRVIPHEYKKVLERLSAQGKEKETNGSSYANLNYKPKTGHKSRVPLAAFSTTTPPSPSTTSHSNTRSYSTTRSSGFFSSLLSRSPNTLSSSSLTSQLLTPFRRSFSTGSSETPSHSCQIEIEGDERSKYQAALHRVWDASRDRHLEKERKELRPKRAEKPDKRRGFMEYERGPAGYRPPFERLKDWGEIFAKPDLSLLKTQTARCMDCGIPFCNDSHDNGCPLGNKIPEWNELVYQDDWKKALERLLETNNFPEFTGRVCPAPCEGACVLGLTEKPVTIKNIENAIIDRGFDEGWIAPRPPPTRSGRRIAVVGSGPAGLAAADQLNKAGHSVTVYEMSDRAGGLLMYGVPNMKLDKEMVVERRLRLMRGEGVNFVTNVTVGVSIPANVLLKENDSVILATGSTLPLDLQIEGRHFKGIHFAMDFLGPNTRSYLDSRFKDGTFTNPKGKKVIVIGGGDTGTDCIGSVLRHGCSQVHCFELINKPPGDRPSDNPWPQWPRIFRVDYGHEEASARQGEECRQYGVLSKRFLGDEDGNVTGIETVRVEWSKNSDGKRVMVEVPGSTEVWEADLVFLAMGYKGPNTSLLGMDIKLNERNNIQALYGQFTTNLDKVYAAGDCRRGQSTVVWAISEGRQVAREVDRFLMGTTQLR